MTQKRKRPRPSVEVPKTSKSPTRNKRMRERKAWRKKWNSPKEVAKRKKEFQRAWDKGKVESLFDSDGFAPKASQSSNFKIDKRSSSSVAILPRDSKEHETAFKYRQRPKKQRDI